MVSGQQIQQMETREKLVIQREVRGPPQEGDSTRAQTRNSLVLVVLRWLGVWRGLESCIVLIVPQLVEVGLPIILCHQGLRIHAPLWGQEYCVRRDPT